MPENRDTISREAAKNALCQLCRDISNWRMCERNDECNLICRIDGVPAAEARPVVHGKWKHGVCQTCFFDWSVVAPFAIVPNFCPNCGAKMEES